jgi:hypothetical protein
MPETEERVTCFAADILAKPQGVCEAAEADVADEDVLGVDERVGVRRGVRGGQLTGARRWHRSDGSGELLPELERLPFGLDGRRPWLPAFASPPPLVISNTGRFPGTGSRMLTERHPCQRLSTYGGSCRSPRGRRPRGRTAVLLLNGDDLI